MILNEKTTEVFLISFEENCFGNFLVAHLIFFENASKVSETISYFCFRTSREKEEWFNRLLVAAKFMEDWEHQNPKDPLKVNPEYETQKVKQQKFNIFMEDYFQVADLFT